MFGTGPSMNVADWVAEVARLWTHCGIPKSGDFGYSCPKSGDFGYAAYYLSER